MRNISRLLSTILLLGVFILYISIPTVQAQMEDRVFHQVYNYLKYFHISQPTDEELSKHNTLEELIASVDDPYTYYLTPEEFEEISKLISGDAAGIGIMLSEEEEGWIIVDMMLGSPLAEHGFFLGDLLLKVDDVSIEGMELEAILSLFEGEEGTSVKLTIDKYGYIHEIEVERVSLDRLFVGAYLLQDVIGYIQIAFITDGIAEAFREKVDSLFDQGMEALILDLRGNPGGSLVGAEELIGEFISEGAYMYSIESNGDIEEHWIVDGSEWGGIPIVVLINGDTASAAEIIASTLVEYGIAISLGETSYGKGTGQNIIPLADGGALSLTVIEFFTSDFLPINGVGIEPDVYVPNYGNYGFVYQIVAAMELFYLEGPIIISDGRVYDLAPYVKVVDGEIYMSIRYLYLFFGGYLAYDPVEKVVIHGNDDYEIHEKVENNPNLVMIDAKAYLSWDRLLEIWE